MALFHASTMERSGADRSGWHSNVWDGRGEDRKGVLLGVHNVKYGTGQERIGWERNGEDGLSFRHPHWTGVERIGMDRNGADSSGGDWIGQDGNGLDWRVFQTSGE